MQYSFFTLSFISLTITSSASSTHTYLKLTSSFSDLITYHWANEYHLTSLFFAISGINMVHLSIPNYIAMSLVNILTVWIRKSRALLLLQYNLRPSMNIAWFIVFPVWNSYPGVAVLSMCVGGMRAVTNSNDDITSPWKIPLFVGTSTGVQYHELPPPSRTSSIFQKKSQHFLLDNWPIPSLSFSYFVLFPQEASYLCINGPQYPLTLWLPSASILLFR